MERTITVNDSLQDRTDDAITEVKELLLEYCNDNKPDSFPCLNSDLDYSGSVHEIVDSCVPIYYHEIDTAWYLHKDKLIEAYENAGVGDNPLENGGMSAIYFYIQDQVNEWYNDDAEEVYDEWKEQHDKEQESTT